MYDPLIKKYIQEYLKELEYRRKAPNTILARRKMLGYFDMWLKRMNYDFKTFDKIQLNEYLNRRPRKNATISSYMSSIKGLYNYMAEEGIIPKDPLKNMKLPRKIRKPPEIFTDDELIKILDYWDTTSNYLSFRNLLILYVLAGTGIRREELANMRKKDITIDYQNGNVEIYVKIKGKGYKERIIDFPPVVVGLYLLYYEKYLKDREDDYIWFTKNWNPMDKQTIYDVVRYTCKKVGVPLKKAHPHIFRHTYVTNIVREEQLTIEDGIHLKNAMGWANMNSLMYYYQLVPERRKRVTIDRNILIRVSTYQGRILGKIFRRKKATNNIKKKKGEK